MLSIEEVEFSLECESEDIPIRDHHDTGDPDFDEQYALDIENRLESGDVWAWCCVKVTASWKDLACSDYLGGCSYASAEDFKQGGYYSDMKNVAFDQLKDKVESRNRFEAMAQGDLDDAVHEAKSKEASRINNDGREAQMGYLEE